MCLQFLVVQASTHFPGNEAANQITTSDDAEEAPDDWFQDDEAEYWDVVEQDLYEPREVFADDEEGFDDVGDL